MSHVQEPLTLFQPNPTTRKRKSQSPPSEYLHPDSHVQHFTDVAEISGKRTHYGQIQYLVKWELEYNTMHDIQHQKKSFTVEKIAPTDLPPRNNKHPRISQGETCQICELAIEHTEPDKAINCSSHKCRRFAHASCTTRLWQCSTCIQNGTPDHRRLYEVQSAPAWQLERTVRQNPHGP